jgi:FkbM family methyltransferase
VSVLSAAVRRAVPPSRFLGALPPSSLKAWMRGAYHRLFPQLPADCYVEKGSALAYVGFYRAEYAAELAEAVGPGGQAVLVEGHPENYRRLVEGLASVPNRERIVPLNLALWMHRGTVPFEIYDDTGQTEFHKIPGTSGESFYPSSARVVDVPCDSFDGIFAAYPRIRHVFVTINGAELQALDGMSAYLRTPGASAWIKSPFADKATGEPMFRQVARGLARHGMRVVVGAGSGQNGPMGKVYGYQPLGGSA